MMLRLKWRFDDLSCCYLCHHFDYAYGNIEICVFYFLFLSFFEILLYLFCDHILLQTWKRNQENENGSDLIFLTSSQGTKMWKASFFVFCYYFWENVGSKSRDDFSYLFKIFHVFSFSNSLGKLWCNLSPFTEKLLPKYLTVL